MTTQITDISDAPAKKAAAPTVKARVVGEDVNLSGKKKTITIHVSELEGGRDAVSIGINGYTWQVPRGIPVEVPVELVHVLENAKTSTYTSTGKPGEYNEQVNYRFAFSVH